MSIVEALSEKRADEFHIIITADNSESHTVDSNYV